jgi:hypothetical protein
MNEGPGFNSAGPSFSITLFPLLFLLKLYQGMDISQAREHLVRYGSVG